MLKKIPYRVRNYFYALQCLGYHCEVTLLKNGLLGMCTAVNAAGHRLAIEVDIPSRRFINDPKKVNPASLS